MREGQAGQGGGRQGVGGGMGAPPVLIGQATQRKGSTETVFEGRAGRPYGGGARGVGGGGGAPPVLIGQATQKRGGTVTVYEGRAGGPGGGGTGG